MRRSGVIAGLLACFMAATTAQAETLTLQRAIAMALVANADVDAARAAQSETGAQRDAASRAWMPRITVEEGWQRGNQPVFAFGSLLAQRRFTEADFAVQSLNHPDPISNHRASLLVQQSIFDGGGTRARADAAAATFGLSGADRRRVEADTAVAVVTTYGDALIAEANGRAARAAIQSATQDVSRAEARRDQGRATPADVLSLQVHLAEMQARAISAAGEARIARARLNRVLGAAIDTDWELVAPPVTAPRIMPVLDVSLADRPDIVGAAIQVEVADAAAREARALLLPRIGVEGGYEWNGSTWTNRAPAWLVGVRGELSLSLGGGEAARARAAEHAVARARAEKTSIERAARVDLLAARERLDAALAREDVAIGAVSHARESERIIRERYEAGLAGVTDVLHAADAVLDAESLEITSHVDALVASVMLDRALGRIPDVPPSGGQP
ncbi:MAG TPA: TolC family protein [Vicinamibacterales bacterium]|nr:TolC family protein [Vicinamibacterales bacterium]